MGESYRPPVGKLDFGSFRRIAPISRQFGYDRGLPIDRYYIERWLGRRALDIRGSVLEAGDDGYTRQFGGDRVNRPQVLHLFSGTDGATFVADLSDGAHLPGEAFDCVILTQTLHLIYEVRAAIRTLHRILRPGGVLLATFPGISQRSDDEWASYWCWSFTSLSASRLFSEVFDPGEVTVESRGNVLAAVSFLEGLAAAELSSEELEVNDPAYPVVIAVRAVKSASGEAGSGHA
ncbi:MAG TPA: methyltransferase domain-containing protein [Streptosporangiaceae bacterium]